MSGEPLFTPRGPDFALTVSDEHARLGRAPQSLLLHPRDDG
jgi:hypothetical protein